MSEIHHLAIDAVPVSSSLRPGPRCSDPKTRATRATLASSASRIACSGSSTPAGLRSCARAHLLSCSMLPSMAPTAPTAITVRCTVVVHELCVPLPSTPPSRFSTHLHAFEEQLRGVLAVQAHLVEHAAHAISGQVLGLHHDDGQAAAAILGVGSHHQHQQAREPAVGDKGLATIDDVVIALFNGARTNALEI